MRSRGYLRQPAPAGAGYRLDRGEVVLRGRARQLRRTAAIAAGLFLAQWPMRAVVTGDLHAVQPMAVAISVRLSLLVDAMFISAYLALAARA